MGAGLNVHLQQLAYLREAARSTTWREAASRLHISQPALSQALRELERRLGVSLFERQGRRQRLTETGAEVVSFAESVLAQSETFVGRLEALQRGEVGRLRVGMIDAVCLYLMPKALRTMQREYPDIELELTVGGSVRMLRQLRAFDLDLAVVVGPVQAADLRATLIASEPFYIYRSPGVQAPLGESRAVLYPSTSRTRGHIDTALVRRGIRPRVALESSNPQVLRQMVAMGFGWSALPARVAEDGPDKLRRAEDTPLMHRRLVAVQRAEAAEDPRVERLLALVGG